MGPNPMTCPYRRGNLDTETYIQRGEGNVEMKAEIRVMQLQVKNCWLPSEARKRQGRRLQREHDSVDTLISYF